MFSAASIQYKIIAVTETPLHCLLARMGCRPELLVMLNFICTGRFQRILKGRPLGVLEICTTFGYNFPCVWISFSNIIQPRAVTTQTDLLYICQFVLHSILACECWYWVFYSLFGQSCRKGFLLREE